MLQMRYYEYYYYENCTLENVKRNTALYFGFISSFLLQIKTMHQFYNHHLRKIML